MAEQKKPMTALDYIQKSTQASTNQNKYSALAEYPPLSYSKAVNPEKGQSSKSEKTQTATSTQKSDYHLKPQKQHLLTTHFTQQTTLKDLQHYTTKIFYDDSLYLTDNLTKNRTFYEYVLVDSKSVEVTHHPDPKNPDQISYSTCKILKIHSIKDLGFTHLHTIKPFNQPGFHIQGYSYVDYQNAFFRAFYVRPYTHSWFISLDHNCPKTIPAWFYEWWHWFGPTNSIYPPTIPKTLFPYYQSHLPPNTFPLLSKVFFHIDMGVPWICSWHFNLIPLLPDLPYSLVKEYRVKWWDKYNLDRCSLANITKHFSFLQKTRHTIQTVSKSIPLLLPSQLSKPIPPPTTQPQPSPKATSPAHSSGSSASKSTKKAKLQQLLQHIVTQLDDSEDDEPMVDVSTQPTGISNIQDSQDPFEL